MEIGFGRGADFVLVLFIYDLGFQHIVTIVRTKTGFDDDESRVCAIRTLCELVGEIAKAEKQDPVRFRDKVAASGLRKLGAIGGEAEVLLAEAFFTRGPRRP